MVIMKIIYVVITLTLFSGEIRGNVVSGNPAVKKYVPLSSVLPPSILYLLRTSSPMRKQQVPQLQQPPQLQQLPPLEQWPKLQQVPLQQPVNPNIPVSATASRFEQVPLQRMPQLEQQQKFEQLAQPVNHELELPPTNSIPQYNNNYYTQQMQQMPQLPQEPQLPSLYSSPVRSPSIQPRHPIKTYRVTPQNEKVPSDSGLLSYDNPEHGNRKLTNIVRIPLKPRPQPANENSKLSDKVSSEPSDNQKDLDESRNLVGLVGTEASPIPVESENKETNDIDIITFNPRDLPIESADNIEASPIPVRSDGNETKEKKGAHSDLEDSLSSLVKTKESSVSAKPVKKETTINNEFNDSEDSSVQTDSAANTETSPSLIKSNETVDNEEESDIKKEKPELNSPKSFQPKPLDSTPESNGELSTKASTDREQPTEPNDKDKGKTQKNQEPQNPLKDLILNGTSPPVTIQPRHPIKTYRVAAQNDRVPSNPALLSYDNPAEGNRKLINIVRIPLKPRQLQPSNGKPKLNDKTSTESLDTASPIPVESEKKETNDIDIINFNPRDLPIESADNIEASPIPVRSDVKETKEKKGLDRDLEDSLSSPVETQVIDDDKNLYETKNSTTYDPKDLPSKSTNLEVSPIPIKPGNKGIAKNNNTITHTKNKDSTAPKKIEENEDGSSIPAKLKNKETTNNEELANAQDLQVPTNSADDIETSPSSIEFNKSNFNGEKSDIKKETPELDFPGSSQPKPLNAANDELSTTASTNCEQPSELNDKDKAGIREQQEPQNPLEDLILNDKTAVNGEENEDKAAESSANSHRPESSSAESVNSSANKSHSELSKGSSEETKTSQEGTSSSSSEE